MKRYSTLIILLFVAAIVLGSPGQMPSPTPVEATAAATETPAPTVTATGMPVAEEPTPEPARPVIVNPIPEELDFYDELDPDLQLIQEKILEHICSDVNPSPNGYQYLLGCPNGIFILTIQPDQVHEYAITPPQSDRPFVFIHDFMRHATWSLDGSQIFIPFLNQDNGMERGYCRYQIDDAEYQQLDCIIPKKNQFIPVPSQTQSEYTLSDDFTKILSQDGAVVVTFPSHVDTPSFISDENGTFFAFSYGTSDLYICERGKECINVYDGYFIEPLVFIKNTLVITNGTYSSFIPFNLIGQIREGNN